MKQLKRLISAIAVLVLMMNVVPAMASEARFLASAGPFSFDLPGEWKLLGERDNGFDVKSIAGSCFFTPAFYDEKIFNEPDPESAIQYIKRFYSSRYDTQEKELNGHPLFLFQGIVQQDAYELTGCVFLIDHYVMIVYYYEPDGNPAAGEQNLMEYLSTLRFEDRFVFGDTEAV